MYHGTLTGNSFQFSIPGYINWKIAPKSDELNIPNKANNQTDNLFVYDKSTLYYSKRMHTTKIQGKTKVLIKIKAIKMFTCCAQSGLFCEKNKNNFKVNIPWYINWGGKLTGKLRQSTKWLQ